MEDPWKDLPDFNRDLLVDYGGWTTFGDAKQLIETNAVKSCSWEPPYLIGSTRLGGVTFQTKLNLSNPRIPENSCNCSLGKEGLICPHALALCLYAKQRADDKKAFEEKKTVIPQPQPQLEIQEGDLPVVQSLVLSERRGLPLKFRVLLPPNLVHTAPHDSIMIKVDAMIKNKALPPEKLDRGRAYRFESDAYLKVAKHLEDWCDGRLFGLIQLTRARLRTLLDELKDEPAVFRPDQMSEALKWENGVIPEVYELLQDDDADDDEEHEEAAKNVPKRFDYGTTMEVDGSMQYLAISLPSKESVLYESAHELVRQNGFQFEPSNKMWWLRDRRKTLNFLACYWNDLKKRFRAEFSKNFLRRTKKIRFAKIACKATAQDDGFKIQLKLDAKGADNLALRNTLTHGEQFLETPRGIVLIEPKKIDRFRTVQRALSQDVDRPFSPQFATNLSAAELVEAHDLLDGLVSKFEVPEKWRKKSEALKDFSKLHPAPVNKVLNAKLREYQKIGTAWMWHLYNQGLAGVLADEMGLGKTVQALAFLDCIWRKKERIGPNLVVCPASLLENWRREAHTFTPELKVYIHHGIGRKKSLSKLEEYDLIITSYSTLRRDAETFHKIDFDAVIADEAQHIKNRQTQNAKALMGIKSKGKFVLTGTPLENSMDDLRSLFEFLLPDYLAKPPKGCRRDNRAWYDERARHQVTRYILRRSKKLVAPELPEKIEQVFYCEMDAKQEKFYKSVQEQTQKAIQELEMSGASEGQIRFAALAQLTRLRQICADPRILDDSMDSEDSTKLKAFKEILQEAIDGGHRMLVFSQFVSVLQILKKELEEMGVEYCYLDGKTKNRAAVCDRFNIDDTIPVFLISLKAGGVGLNLTGANMVVHYDPWWNPAVEAQATDRAHRIGQKRVVTSIKLLVTESVEEKVLELQINKAEMLKEILDESASATASIGLKQIKELIS